MKFVMLLLSLFVIAVSCDKLHYLGSSMYVPDEDLLGSIDAVQLKERVFQHFPEKCLKIEPYPTGTKTFTEYEDTKTFYTAITVSTDLDVSLQNTANLGVTLTTESQFVASESSEIMGGSLEIIGRSMTARVNMDCYSSYFSPQLVVDLEHLPKSINEPWYQSSWNTYHDFLQKYGSHVIIKITSGSAIHQRSFSRSSHQYTQRDMLVKSCVGLGGPTDYGKINVSMCEGIEQKEVETVEDLFIKTKLTVNGGKKETRAELLSGDVTAELIEKFMNEADDSDSIIEYNLVPVWQIIKTIYAGTEYYAKGQIMESYYEGFFSYGCSYRKPNDQIELRKFDLSSLSDPDLPVFECTVASAGCHDDDDCHYHVGPWCQCYGDSCVRWSTYTGTEGLTHYDPTLQTSEGWGWQGCALTNFWTVCSCHSGNINKRVRAWPSPKHHQSLYSGNITHSKLMTEMKKKQKEEL